MVFTGNFLYNLEINLKLVPSFFCLTTEIYHTVSHQTVTRTKKKLTEPTNYI